MSQKRVRSIIFSLCIISAWLITMGILLKNYVWLKEPAVKHDYIGVAEAVNVQWTDREDYALLIKNNKVTGATATTVKKITNETNAEEPSYRSDFRLSFKGPLALFGKAVEVKAAGELNHKFHVQNFYAEADLLIMKFNVTGKVWNDLLLLKIDKNGDVQNDKWKLEQPISMLELVQSTLAQQIEIRTGSKASIPVMDSAFSMQKGVLNVEVKERERITVDGQERSAYRIEMSLNDIKTVMWADAAGNSLRRQLPGGITMDKTTSATAIQTAPVLADSLTIPELNPADYENVPVSNNKEIERGQSPLAAMEKFLQ